ncbi:MAG TPA: hypothetical protein VH092_25155 [Urbifossiella sp.]|nr:hypothetical protein [Urbifossiella sp.]
MLGDRVPVAPGNPDRDGFVEVTVMIDAERRLQVGTVLKNATGELVGAYFFRDVELVTDPFPPETFTERALRVAK